MERIRYIKSDYATQMLKSLHSYDGMRLVILECGEQGRIYKEGHNGCFASVKASSLHKTKIALKNKLIEFGIKFNNETRKEEKMSNCTETKQKVLNLKKKGYTVNEIAAQLKITPSAVYQHLPSQSTVAKKSGKRDRRGPPKLVEYNGVKYIATYEQYVEEKFAVIK